MQIPAKVAYTYRKIRTKAVDLYQRAEVVVAKALRWSYRTATSKEAKLAYVAALWATYLCVSATQLIIVFGDDAVRVINWVGAAALIAGHLLLLMTRSEWRWRRFWGWSCWVGIQLLALMIIWLTQAKPIEAQLLAIFCVVLGFYWFCSPQHSSRALVATAAALNAALVFGAYQLAGWLDMLDRDSWPGSYQYLGVSLVLWMIPFVTAAVAVYLWDLRRHPAIGEDCANRDAPVV